MQFKDKNVLVTGGSRGLGFEICKHFLDNGAFVFCFARTDADLMIKNFNDQNYFKNIVCIKVDVSDKDSVSRGVSIITEQYGQVVDILVNNAGIVGPKNAIELCDSDEWIQTIQTNLYSNLYLIQALLPQMKKQNYGRIVSLSGGGATKPMEYMSAYSASKTAVVRMIETIAKETKNFNIKLNCLAPGALNTQILEEVLRAGPEYVGRDYYNKCLEQQKSGGASISAAAEVCLQLCSEKLTISGKLVSAVWDDLTNLDHLNEEQYTLRRLL